VSLLGTHALDRSHAIKSSSALAQRRSAHSLAAAAGQTAPLLASLNGLQPPSPATRPLGGSSPTPGANRRPGTTTGLAFAPRGDAALSLADAAAAQAVLARIAAAVRSRRLDLKWKLQDYDWKGSSASSQHEHVTASQFGRALSELRLLPMPPDAELGLLTGLYAPTDGRHEPGLYVNYRRFLTDVDATFGPHLHGGAVRDDGEDPAVTSAPGRCRPSPLRAQLDLLQIRAAPAVGGPPRGLAEVLDGLAAHCGRHRVRLREFFADGDSLRTGRLPRGRVRQSLAACGYPLPDAEFALLAAAVALPSHRGRDAGGLPLLDWATLAADVARRLGEGSDAVDAQLVRAAATGPRAYGGTGVRGSRGSNGGGGNGGGGSFGSRAAAGFLESFGADFGGGGNSNNNNNNNNNNNALQEWPGSRAGEGGFSAATPPEREDAHETALADAHAHETAAALEEIARLCTVCGLGVDSLGRHSCPQAPTL
jgi:hypothetical protein